MGGHNLRDLRDFSEHEPVNLQAILPETLFECARSSRALWFSNRDEVGRRGSDALNQPKVFSFIGRDSDDPAWRKRMRQGDKELFRYNTAGGMAPLRPRIGKHQMKDGNRTGRQELSNRIGNVATQDPGVAQTAQFDLAAGASHSPDHPLNPKKISCRIRRSQGGEKQAVAAPEINLERCVAPVDILQIERREIIRTNDFRLVCYPGRDCGHTE